MTTVPSKTYNVSLDVSELLLLDGKVSEKVQSVINQMKAENSYGFDFALIGEILRKSEETGKLTWKYKPIRSCPYCDKKHAHALYPRNSRYHRKGERNTDKPIYYSGVEFHPGFIDFVGMGDICLDCAEKRHLLQTLIDYILDNGLKIEIQKNDYRGSMYFYDPERVCSGCREPMYESEMGRSPTLFGDGTYPSTCPHCGAKSTAFGMSHITTKNFRLVKGEAKRLQGNGPSSHVPVRQED